MTEEKGGDYRARITVEFMVKGNVSIRTAERAIPCMLQYLCDIINAAQPIENATVMAVVDSRSVTAEEVSTDIDGQDSEGIKSGVALYFLQKLSKNLDFLEWLLQVIPAVKESAAALKLQETLSEERS